MPTRFLKVRAAVNTLGVKAEGNNKLVVSLDKRIPYFKLLMGFPLFFPQQEKAVEKYGSKYGTASKYMVYNGPLSKLVGLVQTFHGSFKRKTTTGTRVLLS